MQHVLSIEYILLTFINRYWLIAAENILVTAGLGSLIVLSLKKIGGDWLSPISILSMKRLVYLFALCKGAWSLIFGIAFKAKTRTLLFIGVQFPDLRELTGRVAPSPWAIWKPGALTEDLTKIMLFYAAACLIARYWRVRAINNDVMRNRVEIQTVTQMIVAEAIESASSGLRGVEKLSIDIVVVRNIATSTPYLLGFWNPKIILREDVLHSLSKSGWLITVLRHELMHIIRRDQRSRWVQMWIQDILAPAYIGRLLGKFALETEEQLCDCGAIRSLADASALIQALSLNCAKTNSFELAANALLPSLDGTAYFRLNRIGFLKSRLEQIVSYATYKLSPRPLRPLWLRVVTALPVIVLLLLLLLILYVRVLLFWMV